MDSNLKHKVNVISRDDSWHGNTLSALALGGMTDRQEKYKGMLDTVHFHKVRHCLYSEDKYSEDVRKLLHSSKQSKPDSTGQSSHASSEALSPDEYVDALLYELKLKFDELQLRDENGDKVCDKDGNYIDTVVAFVAEPWVGAVSGGFISGVALDRFTRANQPHLSRRSDAWARSTDTSTECVISAGSAALSRYSTR